MFCWIMSASATLFRSLLTTAIKTPYDASQFRCETVIGTMDLKFGGRDRERGIHVGLNSHALDKQVKMKALIHWFIARRVTCVAWLLGVVFVISAVSKLFSLGAVELYVVQQNLLPSRALAAYAMRFLIAVELCLGLACFLRAKIRQFTLPAIFGMLVFFSLFLAYQAFIKKDTESCHCFGELIRMSPLESLFKNLVLIGIVLYLFFATKEWASGRWLVPSVLTVFSLGVIFIGFPVRQISVQPSSGKPLSEKSRFAEFRAFNGDQTADLTKGTCLVAFVSLDCDHCKALVTSLVDADGQNAVPPTYLICLGETNDVPAFLNDTGAGFPTLCVKPESFFSFIGERPPRLYLLQQGQIKTFWDDESFDPKHLQTWWKNSER